MPIPRFEEEENKKEKSFLQKLLYSNLDTKKLDEAFQSTRYIEKYGIGKYLEELEKIRPEAVNRGIFKKEASKERKEKNIIQPTGYKKVAGTIPKFEVDEEEFKLGDERISDVGLSESVGHAMASGLIKIPMGFANLAAEISDLFAEEGIPVDQSNVAKLNRWFESTVLGDIMKYSEKKARATATGKITEALVQLVGAYKTAGKTGVAITAKGMGIADKMIDAYKANKYIKTTGKEGKNLFKAADRAKKLKKMSYGREFGAVAIGGLSSAAGVYDIEDIGTFGDLVFDEGNWTALDRREGKDADDDAARRLWNRLKFGSELGFPVLPFLYGTGKVGKLIVGKGKDLAYSNSAFERWVNRWVAQPFRARSKQPLEVAREVRRKEGREASARLIAEDFLRDLDDKTKAILRTIKPAAEGVENSDVISKAMGKLLMSSDDAVVRGKINFKGFKDKELNIFYKSMKNLGVTKAQADDLIGTMMQIRQSAAGFKNSMLQGKNITKSTKAFNTLMNDRFQNSLATDFKIFTDPTVFPFNGFIPLREAKKEVANIFVRHARANFRGPKEYTFQDAMSEVDYILKHSLRRDPVTKAPEFSFSPQSVMADIGVQKKNIAENIVGGKFKADKAGGLIRSESDLAAFKKLFGSFENANQLITNTMSDFAQISAKNNFFNNVKEASAAMTKAGERGLVYPTYAAAKKAFPNVKIIENPLGLKLSAGLPEGVYKSPLEGMFTTEDIAEALKFLDAQKLSSITNNLAYRWLVMIPKGAGQVGKTVLGPFTHSRNFFSGAITTVSTGNIMIPPKEIAKSMQLALRTIQPQTMYRLTGNPKWRNIRGVNTTDPTKLVNLEEGGQGLYQFLLDESVVNSSVTYRDTMGLLRDMDKTGFWAKAFSKMGKKTKAMARWAQDMYIAEDDIWKIFNFFGESYKLNRAFTKALTAGKITKAQMPTQLEMYKEAARTVRNTIPNYSYVSDFVKGSRRSPLGNFVSFPAEIIRTTANIAEEGMHQVKGVSPLLAKYGIKEPILARNGYERLFGAAFAWGAVPLGLYHGVKGLYGLTEEHVQALREMVAPWSVDSTLLPYVKEDGSYGYVDFSHGNFYDTVVNPFQSIVNGVNAKADQPLVTGLVEGMTRAIGRMIDPFVSESIWLGVVMDIWGRGGVSRDGRRIFNEREPLGSKIYKSIRHAAYTMSPGSLPQLRRLYAATMDESLKGEKYEVPQELLGFFGFRGVDVKPSRTLDFKIQDYNRDKRAERNLIYQGTLTGDPVTDNDKIVRQYILANKQHLETMSKIKRVVDAAKVLGMRDKEIREIFKDRGQEKLYRKFLKRNKFQPFSITEGMKDAYKDLAKEKGIPNPLNRGVLRRLQKIEKQLKKQRLNSDYIVRESDWTAALPVAQGTQLAQRSQTPLPPTPGVSQQTIAQVPQQVGRTGLTATETALLSNEEKAMKLRQRGMV